MHIFITGSTGFIGYFLTGELLKDELRSYGADSVNDRNEAHLNNCGNYGQELDSRQPDLCGMEAHSKLFHEIFAETIFKEKSVQMSNNGHLGWDFAYITDRTGGISRIITHYATL